jgi:hypothetical protein
MRNIGFSGLTHKKAQLIFSLSHYLTHFPVLLSFLGALGALGGLTLL